jgi:hypothetical protein
MPLKDPEARRIWVNDYTRRRRSDPIKKARQDELRRARYPKIKDRLNAIRRKLSADRALSRPTPQKKVITVQDKSESIKEKRATRAAEARDAILDIIPKDGTVHRVQDVRRQAKCSGPTLQDALAGTDIQTIKSGKTVFLYRMP